MDVLNDTDVAGIYKRIDGTSDATGADDAGLAAGDLAGLAGEIAELVDVSRALGASEAEAGRLLARMPEKQEPVRQLAYRLFTVCERRKWSEDAGRYNDLVTSWHAIVEASHHVGHEGQQVDLEL